VGWGCWGRVVEWGSWIAGGGEAGLDGWGPGPAFFGCFCMDRQRLESEDLRVQRTCGRTEAGWRRATAPTTTVVTKTEAPSSSQTPIRTTWCGGGLVVVGVFLVWGEGMMLLLSVELVVR
jgi:hypothetical protein